MLHFVFVAACATRGVTPVMFGDEFLLGTRFGVAAFYTLIDSIRPFYANIYLEDLVSIQPKLFVYRSVRAADNFESYPEIKKHIQENFTLDAEFDGYHIYLRNNKLSEKRQSVIEKPKIQKTTSQVFHGSLPLLQKNGSFLQFAGWTVLYENVIDQRPVLALINNSDTTYVVTYRAANKGVMDFSKKPGYKMCGFGGFIPLRELPAGDLQVGVLVENNGTAGFKLFSQTVNRDSLLLNP